MTETETDTDTDGELSCDRCGHDYPADVGVFPDPRDADVQVTWCLDCWVDGMRDESVLTGEEARVVGALEYLEWNLTTVERHVGRTAAGTRELRRRAFDKVTGRKDPDEIGKMPKSGFVADRGD